ncbi:uncharacterized protein RSE6_09437 [Rhynchosporium secalis]|uniref:Uncharacterized protein n=1 Tax=Rhynchosporium secalis TaxID=38038 RepID=A0A1E1MHZ1_RHYSE|nr:uncharacterized protein RSE6_09437 [Rhynchosporium secalis]
MVYRHSTIIIIADGVVIAERDSNIATFGPQTRSSQQIRGKKRNTQQDEESEMALFRRIRIKTEIKVRVKVKAILALTTPPNRRVDGSRSESPSMGTGCPRKARVPTFNFEAVVSDMVPRFEHVLLPGRKAAASPRTPDRLRPKLHPTDDGYTGLNLLTCFEKSKNVNYHHLEPVDRLRIL